MHPNHRTWRIRGIPCEVDREWLASALRHHSDLGWPCGDRLEDSENGGNDVIIHTLTPDLRDNYQVATVGFHSLPSQLHTLGSRGELTIKINRIPENQRLIDKYDLGFEVLIDDHFDGITALFSPDTDREHQIDVLAVSGLGSHPFGSFMHKENGNMWLTKNLPRDIPTARVMIFGYESQLQHSRSHIQLDDLADPVHIAISQILRSSRKIPLVLIGHSLGGLLVKQALIRIAEPGFEGGLPKLLDVITGIVLFGTPNDGLDIDSLVPMVNDQPNRSLLESLSSKNSQVLRRQRQDFSRVLERTKLQLFCFYETELSATATQDPATGRWKMNGPHRFLVSQPSATSCLPAGAPVSHAVSIRRNHSDLVKFSSHDAEYDKVAYVLKQIQEISTSHRPQQRDFQFPQVLPEPQKGNSVTGQQRLAGGTQVHHLVKRPVDDRLSAPVGKRPRLTSHLPESGQAQADNDLSARDQSLNEKRRVKEELIRQLYFSKIDERLTHLAPAQGATCRWFLTESRYQSWQDASRRSEHGGFLWIKGNPGTGKSTLMKHLFEETKLNSRHDESRITLSFFFLARGVAEEKTTTGLYRSLLHQLFEIAPALKESLKWMTDDGARTIQRNGWSEEALKQTLKYAVTELGSRSLTMFVDALDECDADKADDMVSFFEELCDCAAEASVQLRICFSSRYYPTVVIKKGLEVNLEDEAGHIEDIRKYVKLKLRLKWKSKYAVELGSQILEKSSGIFLWAVLVVDILNKENSISIQKLHEHLQKIPPRLNDLFQMILTRDGDNLEQLKLCLHWVLFASRALTPKELYFAIQFGSGKECSGFWDQTDLDLNDMNSFVSTSSKGLAEVTRNKASEVQFIHESVREFLLGRYGNQWSGNFENLKGHGHQILRDCCLGQLNASISQKIEIPDPLPRASQAAQLRDTIGLNFPFLQYSVHNVLHHSNLAQRNGIDQLQFVSSFPMRRWVSLNNILERFEVRRYTDSVSPLYIFGEKNLADLIRTHSKRISSFKREAERFGAPMFAALGHRSHDAVRAFLLAQAENEPPTSPLHWLSGQYEKHDSKRTRHGWAFTGTRRQSLEILEDLIDADEEAVAVAFVLNSQAHGEPLNSLRGSLGLRHLERATKRGFYALLNVLLQRSPQHRLRSDWLDSLLSEATSLGNTAIVTLLLDKGGENRKSLLHSAACRGHVEIVKLLLDRGADVNSDSDYDGEAALSTAVRCGHTSIVRYLLEKGAHTEARHESGRTELSWAFGHLGSRFSADIAALLLEKGADIESRDNDGRTPLSWAAGETDYRTDIAPFLFEANAEIDSRDNDGRTPLSWVAGNYHGERIAKLLLEKGADIELKDKNGRTPLSWAAGQSNLRVVQIFLEEGADIDSKDKAGSPPLSWALRNQGSFHGNPDDVITLLRKAGADLKLVGEAEARGWG